MENAMGENTYKFGRRKGFVTLFRSAAQDDRLSLEARGLFTLMVSLPENWEYTVTGLAIKAGCGKDKIRRLLGELEKVGYLIREQGHDNGGKFSGNIYVLQDEAPPLSGNTDNGENRQRLEPSAGFPTQKNKDIKDLEIKKNPLNPPEGEAPKPDKRKRRSKSIPQWQPERFEGFWAAYPRDEDRAKAVEQWDKLPQDRELMNKHGGSEKALLDEIARGLQRHLFCEDWRKSVGIPYAFRWLRDRKWTEKAKIAPVTMAGTPPKRSTRPCHTEIKDGEEVVVYDD